MKFSLYISLIICFIFLGSGIYLVSTNNPALEVATYFDTIKVIIGYLGIIFSSILFYETGKLSQRLKDNKIGGEK